MLMIFFWEHFFTSVISLCLPQIPKRAPLSFFLANSIFWHLMICQIEIDLMHFGHKDKTKYVVLIFFNASTVKINLEIKRKSLLLLRGGVGASASLATTPFSKEVWLSEFLTENEIVKNIDQCTQICFCKFYIGKFWERRKDI